MRWLVLLALAGCASGTGEYRENAFSPKKGPDCGSGMYAVCDMHMGKPVRCECVEEGRSLIGEPMEGEQDDY